MNNFLTTQFKVIFSIVVIFGLSAYQSAFAAAPYLAFSDLISGPDTGLGDGVGSGVIVTVWGQNLGSSQSGSTITYTDSSNTERSPAHIYYWKNADGTGSSGPANLFESHKMQEIAFSIPKSAAGPGTIHVTVNNVDSNDLPFTVRTGNIYHVKSTGSDSNNGSWSSPWRTTSKIVSDAPAGSTTYVHDVNSGSSSSINAFYLNKAAASSTLDAQFSMIAYPGFHPTFTAQRAIESNNVQAIVVSKLDIYASNYKSVDSNDRPSGAVIHSGATYGIETTKNGRGVANRITDIAGGCASKYHGAIAGDAKFSDKVSNYKILGNEIHDYGCAGSSKLHHTTYLSVRSGENNRQVSPWEFGYNYLHDNKAKFGIHQFDQGTDASGLCGDITGPVRIHNNVIVNQASAGISVGSQCGWTNDFYIENNVLINVGNAAALQSGSVLDQDAPELGGINIRDSGLSGTMYIRNNLVHTWSTDGSNETGMAAISLFGSNENARLQITNNVFYTDLELPFIYDKTGSTPISGENNIWYYSGGTSTISKAPKWDTHPSISDPLLNVSASKIKIELDSPVIDKSTGSSLPSDIYGIPRGAKPDIGPVEHFESRAPKPPTGIIITLR